MAGSEFEIVFFLIGLFLIFIKLVHLIMQKLDLPNVLGEVLVGFILGPSLFGIYYLRDHPSSILTPFLRLQQDTLDTSGIVVSFIAEFAVLLLLFEVGTEIDFDVLKKVKTPALSSAFGGITVPLIFGFSFLFVASQLAPELVIPEGVEFLDVGLFLAVALTATSIGISTRIFLDLGKIRSKVAQTVVGAAVVDDIISVTALALVVAYVEGELSNGAGLIFLEIFAFFVISFFLFKYAIPWIIRRSTSVQDQSFVVFFSIAFMLLMAVLAQTLALAPIIGAFVAGVIIGNEDDFLDVHRDIKPIADWVVPFFFITIGLQIDLGSILTTSVIILGLTLASVGIIGKFIGGTTGALAAGYSNNESKTIGLSMAAKGEVTLIFAVEAFSLGFFTIPLYAAVISLVMIDSFIIPTLLKIGIDKWVPDEDATLKNQGSIEITGNEEVSQTVQETFTAEETQAQTVVDKAPEK